MDSSMLNSALFQLTDLWCQTLEAEEYLSFLEALRFKLKFSSAPVQLVIPCLTAYGTTTDAGGGGVPLP